MTTFQYQPSTSAVDTSPLIGSNADAAVLSSASGSNAARLRGLQITNEANQVLLNNLDQKSGQNFTNAQKLTSQSFNTTNTPASSATNNAATIKALYLSNTVATTAHWIVIVPGNAVPTNGTVTTHSFWNPGTANFQAIFGDDYFSAQTNPTLSGFTVARSSTPTTVTLSAAISQPSYIRINYGQV